MITVCRTRTLQALRADLATAEEATAAARSEAAGHRQEAGTAIATAVRAETVAEELRARLATAAAEAARAAGELEALRAQVFLDTEDRAALRMLLRTARRSAAPRHVFALLRRGELHSVHATWEEAHAAAEAEGASPTGWAPHPPGELRPASEVEWRVQPVPLGGAR